MAGNLYRIEDEPRPGALQRIAVNPLWPLLAIMFGGAWLSWPWFVLNGFALGSPTRARETAFAIAGLVGTLVLVIVLVWLGNSEVLDFATMRYLVVGLTVWKLGVTYWLYTLQSRCFSLYEHFGGTARNGLVVVVIAAFASPVLFEHAPPLVQSVLR